MSTQITFTLDSELAEMARRFNVDVSKAARDGVASAVKRAMGLADRAAYERMPEEPDSFWDEADAWRAGAEGTAAT